MYGMFAKRQCAGLYGKNKTQIQYMAAFKGGAIEVITAKSFRTYKPQIKIYRERMHTGLSNSLRFANIIITNLNLYTVLVSSSKLMLS